MQMATIGPWEFEMPNGWKLKENESSDSYFEAPDGTQGLYVKVIELPAPKPSPLELASYIQGIHSLTFSELENTAWVTVNNIDTEVQGLARSCLDLYDSKSMYRVLSLVVCDASSAIQVSIHDYSCEDYNAVQDTFIELENSITRSAAV